jgi:hypothetical protein
MEGRIRIEEYLKSGFQGCNAGEGETEPFLE